MSKRYIINYKKQSINLLIKKNKLSRNYKLTFDKKNFQGLVSIPYYVTFDDGLKFAKENIEWLSKEMKKISPLIYIKNNSSIMIKGEKTKIIFRESKLNGVYLKDKKIIVMSNKNNFNRLFKQWLDEQIIVQSKYFINAISKKLNLNIKGLKLSNSFNYWGSCNTNGVIHLNWRLIFAPTNVLNYIIVHEICHLIEFNHTQNFWRLVEKFCPNYKEQVKWLKKNDNYLYRIRLD